MSDVAPDLSDVITAGLERVRLAMRTATPARVVSYDAGTDMIVAMPLMRARLRNGDEIDVPTVDRVPVVWPSGGGWTIASQLVPGDEVLLVISDRDISGWIDTGQTTTPATGRSHNLTDAMAIVGLTSAPRQPQRKPALGELIIARGDGSTPEISLQSVDRSITVTANSVLLGNDTAIRGVARQNDVVTAAIAGETLLTNIQLALVALGGIGVNAPALTAIGAVTSALEAGLQNLGTISTSSAIVKSV